MSATPVPRRLRIARAVAASTLAVGTLLLGLMVSFEGEPGLLPLVLVLGGVIGLGIAQARIVRHRREG